MILLISPDTPGHRTTIEVLQKILNLHYPHYSTVLHLLNYRTLSSTDPTRFVFEHHKANLAKLQKYVPKVELIIYDFFAIEGYLLGQKYNIPHICSVPAVMGPRFFEPPLLCQEAERWVKELKLHPKQISDGLIVEGTHQLVWNYKKLHEAKIQGLATYSFVGAGLQFSAPAVAQLAQTRSSKYVYFSLGTVVPNSIYHQHPKTRQFIIDLCRTIIYFVASLEDYTLLVSLPVYLQEHIHLSAEMGKRVTFDSYMPQTDLLRHASLFITHGGGNSFHEALYLQCPMLVIPFFGDQHQVAEYVNQHQLGIGLTWGKSVTTDQSSDMKDFPQLVSSICQLLLKPPPRTNFTKVVNSREENLATIQSVLDIYLPTSFPDTFASGDLLFGTTKDRLHLVKHYGIEDQFQIGTQAEGKYLTLEALSIPVPTLIDQWNDLLRTYSWSKLKTMKKLDAILPQLARYKDFVVRRHPQALTIEDPIQVTAKPLLHMCCLGLEFFLLEGHTIHFTFNDYSALHNPGTRSELAHLVKFVQDVPEAAKQIRVWRYLPQLEKYVAKPVKIIFLPSPLCPFQPETHQRLKRVLQKLVPSGFWFQSRVKTQRSICTKMESRHLERSDLYDISGFRVIYPWFQPLEGLAKTWQRKFGGKLSATERGKVLYLIGKWEECWFEIQFWPTILYQCFEYEHALIYKGTPSAALRAKSEALREKEHQLQNLIDDKVLIPY